MAGDAVDMRVGTANPTNDYKNQRTAAKAPGVNACVEPYPKASPQTHMDWRTLWTSPEFAYYYDGKRQCPPGW